jgi:hypothetical protein
VACQYSYPPELICTGLGMSLSDSDMHDLYVLLGRFRENPSHVQLSQHGDAEHGQMEDEDEDDSMTGF